MSNFKRKRPKNRRAGCLFCKPHKMNGYTSRNRNMRFSDWKRSAETRTRLPK